MGPLRWLVVAIAVAAFLVVIDRLLLAAEARGRIYWRRRKASPGSAAGALLELQATLEPDRRHAAEIVREEAHEEDDEGGPGRRETMTVLAGDVGGTKTLLALVERDGSGVRLLHERRFESAAYPGLAPIVAEFLAATGATVERACFGVPGAVAAGECRTPNLPWVIRAAELAAASGIARLRLVNDFAAAAHGVLALGAESLVTLQPGDPVEHGPKAVLGAGTGLGEALLVWDGRRYAVVPTEGGHADFAPQGDEQRALQRHLEERHRGRVSVERVVSGPGLARIHEFLVAHGTPLPPAVRDAMAAEDPAAVISRLGMSGADAGCAHALELFVAAYGAEAGNLALRSLPTGGLYVAGGVAPKIRPRIEDGSFMAAFRAKGRMTEMMATFPVHLVLEPKVGLLGAALEALATASASES